MEPPAKQALRGDDRSAEQVQSAWRHNRNLNLARGRALAELGRRYAMQYEFLRAQYLAELEADEGDDG